MADFEKIFQENQGFVFKFLLKLCKDSVLAEELTQETFFRAYMNISSVKDENKIPVWLCQIAKNTCFSHYNEQKKLVSLDENESIISDGCIEDTFIEKQLSQKALACLHELEEPYKEVFMLSVFGQVSFKEISLLFGKSESWARVTFYRAKQKLSERMR